MAIGENAVSKHPTWDSPGGWSPKGFVPSNQVVWQRNRFRLHAGVLPGILVWVSVTALLIWAARSQGEPWLLGIAATMIWVGFIGPVLHETSHALAGRRVGFKIIGFGVGNRPYVNFLARGSSNTPRAWAVMAVAGPASDLLSAAGFAVVWLAFGADTPLHGFCLFAGAIQGCTGVYNLVPMQGNDGSIIKQARRRARALTVEPVDHQKRLPVTSRTSPNSDDQKPDAVLASFPEVVMEQTLFDDGRRGRLSESFASEIAKLQIGVPARRANQRGGEASVEP